MGLPPGLCLRILKLFPCYLHWQNRVCHGWSVLWAHLCALAISSTLGLWGPCCTLYSHASIILPTASHVQTLIFGATMLCFDKRDSLKYWAEIYVIRKLKICRSKTDTVPKSIKKNRNVQLSQFQGQLYILSQVSISHLCRQDRVQMMLSPAALLPRKKIKNRLSFLKNDSQ